MCAQLYPTLCHPQTIDHQAPLSIEFSRQEYRNGLPFPTSGDPPDPGVIPMSSALAGGCFFTTAPPVKLKEAKRTWIRKIEIINGSRKGGDCRHEIKRHLLLGRKAMINLDCILKSRDITLPTKVHLVKAMVFPVVMYGCDSWTIKKAECWRVDAFELWCGRRLLRVPWTARRSNQSILKEISPGWRTDAEAETPILWPPDTKNWRTGKYPDAGKDWGQEEKGTTEDEMVGWQHRFNGHEFE